MMRMFTVLLTLLLAGFLAAKSAGQLGREGEALACQITGASNGSDQMVESDTMHHRNMTDAGAIPPLAEINS